MLDILETAIPSTLLCEKDTTRRESTMLKILASRQAASSMENRHTVNENRESSSMDAKKEINAGNTNLEIRYPIIPTGVTAI